MSFFLPQDIKHGGTPLHWAKSKEMAVELIEFGCALDARNFKGKTALHVAVEYERLDCAVVLASHGAGLDLKDADGNTALHLAVAQGCVPIVRGLLAFEADTSITNKVSIFFSGWGQFCTYMTESGIHKSKYEMQYTYCSTISGQRPLSLFSPRRCQHLFMIQHNRYCCYWYCCYCIFY